MIQNHIKIIGRCFSGELLLSSGLGMIFENNGLCEYRSCSFEDRRKYAYTMFGPFFSLEKDEILLERAQRLDNRGSCSSKPRKTNGTLAGARQDPHR
jgi:hypothetical protein